MKYKKKVELENCFGTNFNNLSTKTRNEIRLARLISVFFLLIFVINVFVLVGECGESLIKWERFENITHKESGFSVVRSHYSFYCFCNTVRCDLIGLFRTDTFECNIVVAVGEFEKYF